MSSLRKTRKKRSRVYSGSGKFANVFLVDIRHGEKEKKVKASVCYPLDKKKNTQTEPCHEPEWIYNTKGVRTTKVQCQKETDTNEDDYDDKALQATVTDILSKGGKDGDLVENVAESGYRTEGVYILKKVKQKFVISDLDSDFDPYGGIGKDFSLGPDFPIGYWTYAFDKGKHISVTKENLTSKAYWHEGLDQPEPVTKKIIKSIKKAQLKENKTGSVWSEAEFPWGTLRFDWPKVEAWNIIKNLDYVNDRAYFRPLGEGSGVASLVF